ncbi:hypothetical protein CASFOL_042968 [Castilleja foliolosa]|uniref:DRBM domain-containing protein n=1 Tax=Castilleja foliolosa TaxID=1961234 RepID=A0ABD3B777_9LAMI
MSVSSSDTENEHEPQGWSVIWIDGRPYFVLKNQNKKPILCHRCNAEVAEKHELIKEKFVFCKSIVNEYAMEMRSNMKQPTYKTNQAETSIPKFVSSLQLNGLTYTGHVSGNKKDAEQSAARIAVISILVVSESSTMYEIVKSKLELYMSPIVGGNAVTGPHAEIPDIVQDVLQNPNIDALCDLVHVFKKRRLF